MREDIVSFVNNASDNHPFFIEMAGISYCDGSYSIGRKNSHIYIFEYILSGQGTVKLDSGDFTASEGDIYILHKHSNHIYYSDEKNPWTKIWFNADGSLIDSLIQLYKVNHINHIVGLNIKEHFFNILDITKSKDKSYEDIFNEASLVFHEIIIKIAKNINQKYIQHSPEALELKQFIDKNVMKNVSLKELGDLIYRSPSQTIRIFKKDFGITPYNYLMNKKLEIAKLMLLNTNMSVKEISMSLSFADEHYFSNYFKAKAGVSPSKFKIL
jgi:AraC-like DNA-binding protein